MRNRRIAASMHAGSGPGLHHRFLAVVALAEARVETRNLKGAYQKLHSIDYHFVSGELRETKKRCLLEYLRGVPLVIIILVRDCGRRVLSLGRHHDQGLSYGRVSLGNLVGGRNRWRNRSHISDLASRAHRDSVTLWS